MKNELMRILLMSDRAKIKNSDACEIETRIRQNCRVFMRICKHALI